MEGHLLLDSLQLTMAEGQGCLAYPSVEQVLSRFLQRFANSGVQRSGSEAKAAMIRDLFGILEAADGEWLFGGFPQNATVILLRDLVVTLSCYAAPLQQETEELGLQRNEDPSYMAVPDRAADASLVLRSIVTKVGIMKSLEGLGTRVANSVLQEVAGPMFVFAVTHIAARPWTKPNSQRMTHELLDDLLRASDCQSISEFLRGTKEGKDGQFEEVMEYLKPDLNREMWQRNPATKHVFSTVLQQVTRPWLGQHLEKVLPPSLLLSDDYHVENKILGVQCLHHIIQNVPAATLCRINRVHVVNHALSNHLYSKEAQLMKVVLLCVLDLLPILEKAPPRQSHDPQPVTPSDEVLRLLLTHMEAEHQLSLRRVYAINLPTFVERLGIQIVCHLKKLQQVIVAYMEVSDGPEEAARLAILETLKCTIKYAWPRINCRLSILVRALLRMMWDVNTDRSSTPECVKASLLQRATECLLLLDYSSCGQVKVLLQQVYHNCQDAHLKEYLRKIEEEPVGSVSPLLKTDI
uniref:TELO2-interacting protein 2 n=1 Tax=Pogona vitticeps TaxID=103695 RepID=A0A6J0VBG7_9SAUR